MTPVGPNLDCPTVPILPETASKATVAAVINSMVPVYRGGTFINLGLQAGWWALSPNWRGVWGDPNMPLAYNTPYMKKVIVLMTDGNNNWNDWTGGVPGVRGQQTTPNGVPWTDDGDADFTAYGRLLTNTRGLSTTNLTTTLNTWMSQMCTDHQAERDHHLYDFVQQQHRGNPDAVQELRLVPQQLLPEPDRHRSAECLQADRQGAVHIAAFAVVLSNMEPHDGSLHKEVHRQHLFLGQIVSGHVAPAR